MENKSSLPSFSEEDFRKVLGSPAGKALLEKLTANNGAALKQAASAIKAGNTEAAKTIMEPIVNQPDITALISQINREQG